MPVALIPGFLVDRIGWLLIHSLWEFTLIALVVAAVLRVMRRAPVNVRYGFLLLGGAMIVFAPVATWMLLPDYEPQVDAVDLRQAIRIDAADSEVAASPGALQVEPELVVHTSNPLPVSDDPLAAVAVPVAGTAPVELAAPRPLSLAARIVPWLRDMVAVWCVGMLLFALRPGWGWYTLFQLRRRGVSDVPATVVEVLERTTQRLAVHRDVRVLQSTLVRVPLVAGYLRPMILLPAGIVTGLPPEQLEAILAHELAHIRRHDYLVNLAQTLLETVFFYHPAVWWLSSQIRDERENCCDDLAVRAIGSRADYGRALLALEEFRGTSPVLSLGATGGSLLQRVRRLAADDASPRLSTGGFLSAALVTLMLISVGVWTVTRADETSVAESGDPEAASQQIDLRLPTTLRGHDGRILSVAVSGDGRAAITSGQDGTIRIWDTETAQQQFQFNSPGARWVYSVALSPDETEIIAGETGRVATYDLATGRETWHYDGANRDTWFKAVNCDRANHFACASADGAVYVWNISDRDAPPREFIAQRKPDGARLNACCLSPNGSLLALATGTNNAASSQIEIWDVAANTLLRTMIPEFGGVSHLEFSADSARILSCGHSTTYGFSDDGSIASPNNEDSVILWNVATGDVIRKFGLTPPPLTENQPSPQLPPDVAEAPTSHTRITICRGIHPGWKTADHRRTRRFDSGLSRGHRDSPR